MTEFARLEFAARVDAGVGGEGESALQWRLGDRRQHAERDGLVVGAAAMGTFCAKRQHDHRL